MPEAEAQFASKVRHSVGKRYLSAREINGSGLQALESGAKERLGSPRSRGRFATSRPLNRDLGWNHLFVAVGSLVAASRGPLISCIIDDLGRPDNSERIGSDFRDRSEDAVRTNRHGSSEQSSVRAIISPSNQSAECNQSLLPMPKAEFLVGIKGPCVGPGSALGGPENNGPGCQALESGADERHGSPRSRGRFTTSRAPNRDLRCNRWFGRFSWFVGCGLTRTADARIIVDFRSQHKSAGQVRASNKSEQASPGIYAD